MPGNIFQLGNTSWRVLRVEPNGMRVEDAAGEPPNIPFWLGEAPARSSEFSFAVSRLRENLAAIAQKNDAKSADLASFLQKIPGVGEVAADQAATYMLAAYRSLGAMPTQNTLVMERFFDDSGGMQLVIHSPFGSRINKAWGLALRKRFCRTFNFELQAAAVEDAIVISLGAVHSFDLDEVWRYLQAHSVRDVLIQALLDAPVFNIRWRWVATCALAIQRFRSGRKTPPRLIRMNADDLVAVVFPDQLACAENIAGKRQVPDHPLVNQALEDCLTEAMDVNGLENLINLISNNEKTLISKDLTAASPLAQQVLNANPYAFLDDAPLEERRTQAVSRRRFVDPEKASDLGVLDIAAIDRLLAELRPAPRDADELHEAISLLGFVLDEACEALFGDMFTEQSKRLLAAGRLIRFETPHCGWAAAERGRDLGLLWPDAQILGQVATTGPVAASVDAALQALVRSRIELSGPVTSAQLAYELGLNNNAANTALTALEAQGIVLSGRFDSRQTGLQWCDRRLLARIHRYTLNRQRREIEPVSSNEFMQFLFRWQHLTPDTQLLGEQGLAAIIAQLAGFEAPAAAWESRLLPARLKVYQGQFLDQLIRSGQAAWLRLTPKRSQAARQNGTLRNTPLAIMPRQDLRDWLHSQSERQDSASLPPLSSIAERVQQFIINNGASFFDDILNDCALLPSQGEAALDELAAAGLVTCDSFAGLRALTQTSRQRSRSTRSERRSPQTPLGQAGRWDRVRRPPADHTPAADDDSVERVAAILLQRYGVVFRALVSRESNLPPWRYILWALRRMEARGEVRGGRFVAGYSGEQFALVEAASALRGVAGQASAQIITINATDPLNLIGTILPGVRVPAIETNQIAFLGGELAGIRLKDEFHLPGQPSHELATKIRTALVDPLPKKRAQAYRFRRR